MVKRRSKRKGKLDPIESKRAKDSVDQDAPNPEGRKVFPLDKVPAELVWEILDWVPEAIPHLRAASRGMKRTVEDYAKQSASHIVAEEVKCDLHEIHTLGDTPRAFLITDITVPLRHAKLFELRMAVRREVLGIGKLSKLIARFGRGRASRRYKIEFQSMVKDGPMLELVNQSLGKSRCRIIDLTSSWNNVPFPFDAATKLFAGIACDMLSLGIRLDDNAYQLLTPTFIQATDFISISPRENSLSDPRSCLSHLLSNARSVSINSVDLCFTRLSSWSYKFFGFSQDEWAQFIIDMFKNGRLEELIFDRIGLSNYFDLKSADLLRERLPYLGKKIHLKIWCDAYPNRLDYVVNDYHIEAKKDHLIIEHSSLAE